MDNVGCCRIIVRDGRYDNKLYYEFNTEETKHLNDAVFPKFDTVYDYIFFVRKREMLHFLNDVNITKRKGVRCSIEFSFREDDITVRALSKKNEILGETVIPLYINDRLRNNINVPVGQKIKLNFQYFLNLCLSIFVEYDIIGMRFNDEKEVCVFGKNFKKPNICYLFKKT